MGELDLSGILQGRVSVLSSELDDTDRRIFGITLGVVTAVGRGRDHGRVKLRLSWLSDAVETDWAPVAVPWAGRQRGSYLLPDVDDQALVAFRHGEPRRAYVLGFLWSEQAPPPELDPGLHRRGLYSGRGNQLVFDDTPDKDRVQLRSARGHLIDLNDDAGTVGVTAVSKGKKNTAQITLGESGITIEAMDGDVTIKAKGRLNLEGADIDLYSHGSMTIRADMNLTIRGTNQVTIN